MPLNFPDNPTLNTSYVVGGVTYVCISTSPDPVVFERVSTGVTQTVTIDSTTLTIVNGLITNIA